MSIEEATISDYDAKASFEESLNWYMILIPGLSFWTVYHALYSKLWTAQAIATMPKHCHGELHSVVLRSNLWDI